MKGLISQSDLYQAAWDELFECDEDAKDFRANIVYDSDSIPTKVQAGCSVIAIDRKTRTIPAVHTNLSGASLRKVNFSKANLRGTRLVGADLFSANLSKANFSGANLEGVKSGEITGIPSDLPWHWFVAGGYLIGPGANLKKSFFSGTSLRDQNLTGINFKDAIFKSLKTCSLFGKPVGLPVGWKMVQGYLVGPGANMSDCSAPLYHANLSKMNLTRADLSKKNLAGATLQNTVLWNANLNRVNLNGSNLSGAKLTGVKSGSIVGSPKSLPSGWILRSGYLIGPGADLSGADLSGIDLTRVNLTHANLTGANLAETNLTGVNLDKANLTRVRSGSVVGSPRLLPAGWSLHSGYLMGPGANLIKANLASLNLTGVNLDKAKLTRVRSGSIVGSPRLLPAGWSLRSGYLIGPGADLSDADLSGANLSGANLSGANLSGANLSGANLTKTRLLKARSGSVVGTPRLLPAGWSLRSGYLIGPGADLSGADFNGANFFGKNLTGVDLSSAQLSRANLARVNLSGANLSGAILSGANLSGANLTRTALRKTRSGGVTGTPKSLPVGWVLRASYLIGPGADLSDVNFSGKNLTGVNFSGVNLSGTNFAGAKLVNVSFRNSIGYPKNLPNGWVLKFGYLIGPGANLSGAKLPGKYLNGMDLANANLTSANLKYANLTDVNLSGANLRGADLTGATLESTNLTGADLRGAILKTNNFFWPNLTGADLRGAIVGICGKDPNMSVSGNILGRPKHLPTGYTLFRYSGNGYAIVASCGSLKQK